MASTALVVLTTLATEAQARALVTALLADRLVACGTLVPGARSLYRWGGEVTEGAGGGGLPKTEEAKRDPLCRAARRQPPPEGPGRLPVPGGPGLAREP